MEPNIIFEVTSMETLMCQKNITNKNFSNTQILPIKNELDGMYYFFII